MGGRKPLVPIIVGATAVGKTATVLALAERWPLTVISADSRQVYCHLDIGTAKPTREERKRVPHLGIDVIDPGEAYSAGRYARDAARWLREVPADRQAIVVGGTGFYVRALADGLFREPPMDAARRALLRQWTEQANGLGRWATRLDPGFRGGGRQRAGRVVEVALLTGKPLSWWQRSVQEQGVMRPWYLLLTIPRQVLHDRIRARTHHMLERGLIDEVRDVLSRGVPEDAPGLDAVGYRQVVAYLQGRTERDTLEDEIAAATRRYAKRQDTWFRHQLTGYHVHTLDATASPERLADRIVQLWEERGG